MWWVMVVGKHQYSSGLELEMVKLTDVLVVLMLLNGVLFQIKYLLRNVDKMLVVTDCDVT